MDTRSPSLTRGLHRTFPRTSALTEADRSTLGQDEPGSPRGHKPSLPDECVPGKQEERQPDSGRSSPESKSQEEHPLGALAEGGPALSLGLSSGPTTEQTADQPTSSTRPVHSQPRASPTAVPAVTEPPEPTGRFKRIAKGQQQEMGKMPALRVSQIAPPRHNSSATHETEHPLQYVSEEVASPRSQTEQQPLTHTTGHPNVSQTTRSNTDQDAQDTQLAQQPEREGSQSGVEMASVSPGSALARPGADGDPSGSLPFGGFPSGVSHQLRTTPEMGPSHPSILPTWSGYDNVVGGTSGMASVSPGGALTRPGADGDPSGSLPSRQLGSLSPLTACAVPRVVAAQDNYEILVQALRNHEELDPAALAVRPFCLRCPANPVDHLCMIPATNSTLAGCMSPACNLTQGLPSAVRALRLLPCQVCLYHGVPARKRSTLLSSAGQARGKMACVICGQMPFGKPFDKLQHLLTRPDVRFLDPKDMQRKVPSTGQLPEPLLGDLHRLHQERDDRQYTQDELRQAQLELAEHTLDRLIPRAAELDTPALVEIARQTETAPPDVAEQLQGSDLPAKLYVERVIRRSFCRELSLSHKYFLLVNPPRVSGSSSINGSRSMICSHSSSTRAEPRPQFIVYNWQDS